MHYRSSVSILIYLILTLAFSAPRNLWSQENILTKAIQLFDKGNYAEAEPIFGALLEKNPGDFMVNYFYAACRTENGHFSQTELNCLLKAGKEVSPLDIDYYLGMQYHARENWEMALKHYNRFAKAADRELAEKVKLQEKIQQCYDNVNPFTVEEPAPETNLEIQDVETVQNNDTLAMVEDESVQEIDPSDSTAYSQDTAVTATPEPDVQPVQTPDQQIFFNVNPEITYYFLSHFKTGEGKELFQEAENHRRELEKNLQTLDYLRNAYAAALPGAPRDSIAWKILSLENYTYEQKYNINRLLEKARSVENGYWQNADETEIRKFMLQSEKMRETKSSPLPAGSFPPGKVEIPEILVKESQPGNAMQKPAAKSELVYKIQIGAYSRGIPAYKKDLFKKISLIRKIDQYTDEKGVVVYTTGNLTRFEDALIMQKQVRQEGVDDAFIVPYLNGKRITLEQAKEIEGIK